MLALSICSAALVASGPAPTHAVASQPRIESSRIVMMPKFLKTLLPNVEKPDFGSLFGGAAPPPSPIEVKGANAAIGLAGKAMPLLSPIFNLEAIVQAVVFNLGSYDADAVQAEIEETITSAPVVVYTYPLSPFSTEVVSILESSGCKYKNVELGLEWFALGPKGSATRVELRKMFGQGSLPHCFIGGEWVGGLSTGAEGGLAGLVERDELVPMLRKAKAL